MAKAKFESLAKTFSLLSTHEENPRKKVLLAQIAQTYSELAAEDWVAPTGNMSRATFDPATVNLPDLCERVAALVEDFTQ